MTREELKEYLTAIETGNDYYKEVLAEYDRMAAINAKLLMALKAVEYNLHLTGKLFCPWCHAERPQHLLDCQRQAAIRAAEEVN